MMHSFDSIRFRDPGRRAAVLDAAQNSAGLNAIDTVEVEQDNQTTLHVFFLRGVPEGLDGHPERFAVTGGERVTNIRVTRTRQQSDHLDVIVDQAGDFSTYTLTIKSGALDPIFAASPFSFKAGCPSPFDCQDEPPCIEVVEPDPLIDYNAKDYSSFRRALLDWVSARDPNWLERSEADLGTALLELFAYTADQLSDYQDRVANEMFLETARRRLSVKRHSALIDYAMHEGANAKTFLYFRVNRDGLLPAHAQITTVAERGIDPIVFETANDALKALFADVNELEIYTWASADCVLPVGATEVYLDGWHPNLNAGDYIFFTQVKSPITRLAADADRTRRQIVQLTRVERASDPLGPAGQTPRPLTRLTWRTQDALTQTFCLSTICADGSTLGGITLVCGNVMLASHGKTVHQSVTTPPLAPLDESLCQPLPVLPPPPFQFELSETPLTYTTESDDPREGTSTLQIIIPPGSAWRERRTLLESGAFAQDFVVDTDEQGRATVRFGDGRYGRAVLSGATLNVRYRIGNGVAGIVGAETLTQ